MLFRFYPDRSLLSFACSAKECAWACTSTHALTSTGLSQAFSKLALRHGHSILHHLSQRAYPRSAPSLCWMILKFPRWEPSASLATTRIPSQCPWHWFRELKHQIKPLLCPFSCRPKQRYCPKQDLFSRWGCCWTKSLHLFTKSHLLHPRVSWLRFAQETGPWTRLPFALHRSQFSFLLPSGSDLRWNYAPGRADQRKAHPANRHLFHHHRWSHHPGRSTGHLLVVGSKSHLQLKSSFSAYCHSGRTPKPGLVHYSTRDGRSSTWARCQTCTNCSDCGHWAHQVLRGHCRHRHQLLSFTVGPPSRPTISAWLLPGLSYWHRRGSPGSCDGTRWEYRLRG